MSFSVASLYFYVFIVLDIFRPIAKIGMICLMEVSLFRFRLMVQLNKCLTAGFMRGRMSGAVLSDVKGMSLACSG